MRRAAVLFLALLLLGFSTGCEQAPDDEMVVPTITVSAAPRLPGDLPTLPVGNGKVGVRSSVSLADGVLVVDGRRIDLSPLSIDSVAVVPGGIFFLNGRELWFTDLVRASPTGFSDVLSLVGSARGRLIGFIDAGHGPKDSHGTPLALVLAYDARTGRPLLASYEGMGDLVDGDLAASYARARPAVIGFEGDDLVVRGVDGINRIPLRRGLQDPGASPR